MWEFHGWVSVTLRRVRHVRVPWVGQRNTEACPPCESSMEKLVHLFSVKLRQTSRTRTSISSGAHRSLCDQQSVCSIAVQILSSVWMYGPISDWLIKNDFITTSTSYSAHSCLIAPCFVPMKWANIRIPSYSRCMAAEARSPFTVLVALWNGGPILNRHAVLAQHTCSCGTLGGAIG